MSHFQDFESWMKEVFSLAKKGEGMVAPNPLVGALVIKNGRIIGQGFHSAYGKDHAEIEALKNCTESPRGATLICNLEPCAHTNKQTPPCAERLIQEGIAMVVIANKDPNPLVNGLGVKKLKEHGIEVILGVLEKEGEILNRVFFKFMRENIPYVTLKMAQTLDGKIATTSGESKWISDEKARSEVQHLRFSHEAILVGAGTLNRDNPRLNIREPGYAHKQPFRIVVGELIHLNRDAQVLNDEWVKKTILVTPLRYQLTTEEQVYRRHLLAKGIHILEISAQNGMIDLFKLLQELGKMKITSILVEGGQKIATEFVRLGLADEMITYIAPKILGEGISLFASLGKNSLEESQIFEQGRFDVLGSQVVFRGFFKNKILSKIPALSLTAEDMSHL